MKKLIFLLIGLFLFIPEVNAGGIIYDYYDYYIKNYDVDMDISEDNIFTITETIDAYFRVPKHGIIRNIPMKNEIVRNDGTKSTNRAKITEIDVNDPFSESSSNGNKSLKIGSASETITGNKKYVIKYKYDIGNDPLKDADELYYNIIGTEWDVPIKHASFTIKMPKDFDTSKIGFSTGKKGVIGNTAIQYEVNNNVITGEYLDELNVGEGINIRIELEDGYFLEKPDYPKIAIFSLAGISLVIVLFLYFKYGMSKVVVDPVEFYPPEGLNSTDVAYIYNGKVSNKDVMSLLIYLASKGYLKIECLEDKNRMLGNKNCYKLTKLKDYDGKNKSEKEFFSGLFKYRDSVYVDTLKGSFYRTVNKIMDEYKKDSKNGNYFEKSSKQIKTFLYVILIIISLIIYMISMNSELWFVSIFIAIYPAIAIAIFVSVVKNSDPFTFIFMLFWCCGFGGGPLMFFMVPQIASNGYLKETLIATGVMFICFIIVSKFNKRTYEGNLLYGKIKGLKKYLETARKDELEAMVLQNPKYFYDILPFTYVLGISDKWIKMFEELALPMPEWFVSSNGLNDYNSLNRAISTVTKSMTYTPAPSGGGGGSYSSGGSSSSSGGGSSGGGSGGGGGSSW